jgi:hypothetical protein
VTDEERAAGLEAALLALAAFAARLHEELLKEIDENKHRPEPPGDWTGGPD